MGNIEEEYRYVNAKIAGVPLLKFFYSKRTICIYKYPLSSMHEKLSFFREKMASDTLTTNIDNL